MELTQEYLDKKFAEVNQNIKDSTEELAGIINDTVAVPMEEHFAEHKRDLDMRKDVEALKLDIQKIKDALAMNGDQTLKVR